MIYTQEKSIENGSRYVKGLQAMLIDVDNINKAKFHKWVPHIFHYTHFYVYNTVPIESQERCISLS